MSTPPVPDSYRALIDSPRVSTNTRRALLAREATDDPAYIPVAMTMLQLQILRAVMQRILPQPETQFIDLAARLDAQLGEAKGDGWRFAALPKDRVAYANGLSHAKAELGHGFTALSPDLQDHMLEKAASGALGDASLRLWFEDVRADAVKLYVSHPSTLAALGYGGIAYGGDGDDKPGFTQIGLGEREAWEPIPHHAGKSP
jgi:hypothetical protein